MFVDTAKLLVAAGDGGDGIVSFRHEKFVNKGGPDGGDGGKGGDIIFTASLNVNTLIKFRYKQEIKADNGEGGTKRRRHGKNGHDMVVAVPVGTVIYSGDNLLIDLATHGQSQVIAHGGGGGFGNAHFKSSTRQAPRVAEKGEKGDVLELKLELKLLADVGLVGLPNAGKSTFLSVVSAAKPEIADYPFTTLTPNLGMADIDDASLLIADIPGLIEGASGGKGLGDAFLRHIERTSVILHLIDVFSDNPVAAYQTIRRELEQYGHELDMRTEVVAITKVEGFDQDHIDDIFDKLRAVVPKNTALFALSSQANVNVAEVLRALRRCVDEARAQTAAIEQASSDELPVIRLSEQEQADTWQVVKVGERYVLSGAKIERFAARTDFGNPHGVNRLRDIMRRMGIVHELQRQGAASEDTILIGKQNFTLTEASRPIISKKKA